MKVAIRSRPLLADEQEQQLACCVDVMPDSAQVVVAGEKGFTFDYAFDTCTTQEDLYNSCVKDLVAKVISGYNCSVLVYGQTGSGKTYTMGTDYGQQMSGDSHQGILPRVLNDLFDSLLCAEMGEWTVKVSFLEIYNESAYDLLATSKAKEPLAIREIGKVVVLPGLEHITVETAQAALECLKRGCGTRSTGATLLNSNSSRSHAVFTVHLQCALQETVLTSKLQLVDLAGSETVKKTCSVGDRRKEGVNINLGLLALGKVISSLCSESVKMPYISYRGSTLTRLLKESLNGHNYTVMIACISPALCHVVETVSTLRFADRARQIKVKPFINRSNKENAYHRALEAVPPTPAFWRRNGSLPTGAPLQPLRSRIPPRFENASLEPMAEERRNASSLSATSTILCSSFKDNTDAPTTPARQDFPITPLVERMCSRLEKTVVNDVVMRLEAYGIHLGERTVGETSCHDVTLTPEQRTMVEGLNSTIKAARQSLADRKLVKELSASPPLESQGLLDASTERTPLALTPPQGDSAVGRRTRRRTTMVTDNGDRDASPVPSKRPRRSVAHRDGHQPATLATATGFPVSAIAHRTRRRTTIFVSRNDRDAMPPPVATKRPRRSVACRPSAKKALQPSVTVSAEKAQQVHNRNTIRILNSGSEAQLQQLSCVGPKTAKIICLHTKLRGRLESFEALKDVSGLGLTFCRRFMEANVLTS